MKPTPVIIVDTKKDALSPDLQQFCYNKQVALVKVNVFFFPFNNLILTCAGPHNSTAYRFELFFLQVAR